MKCDGALNSPLNLINSCLLLTKEQYFSLFGKLALNTQPAPPRWNSSCRGEGAYPPRSSNQSASTRRAQLSVAAKAVRPTDLLNHVKT